MAIKWCGLCKRNVEEKKDFNWIVFIFLCGICYLPFYMMKESQCPICGSTKLEAMHADGSLGTNSERVAENVPAPSQDEQVK